jgi:Secretion system C-terminal sorting domain
MKKIITLGVLVLCIFAYGYGQKIKGGDFEHWKYNTNGHYWDPDSSIFSTLDTLIAAPTPSGLTAYPCDTVHSGTYSAGLITSYISALQTLIPGVIGTIKINWAKNTAILGTPYPYGTDLPGWFTGWYKSYPLLNDSSAAVVLLSKWNPSNSTRDTIAYNRLAFHGTVDTWTSFITPITYRIYSTVPDTLTILLLSCAGFNASNMFGCVGQVGSRALFDDVNLIGFNGVPHHQMPSAKVKLSPNPASKNMKIELNSSIENGYFEVYDAQSKLIRQISINGNSGQIGVNDLSAGMYYYKLTENKKLLNSGTFVVAK